MRVEVVNRRTGRSCWVAAKVFGKLLHLARSHGWSPHRQDPEWPSSSWNTEIILPHLGAYVPGIVSEWDARDLASALSKVVATGSPGLHPSLEIAALAMLEVSKGGELEVQFAAAPA